MEKIQLPETDKLAIKMKQLQDQLHKTKQLAAMKAAVLQKKEKDKELKRIRQQEILLGRVALSLIDSDQTVRSTLMAALESQLIKDHERAAFGLPPLAKQEPTFQPSYQPEPAHSFDQNRGY
jgi:ATP-dependent protease HslVU (ClpYQ) ATPase subunit